MSESPRTATTWTYEEPKPIIKVLTKLINDGKIDAALEEARRLTISAYSDVPFDLACPIQTQNRHDLYSVLKKTGELPESFMQRLAEVFKLNELKPVTKHDLGPRLHATPVLVHGLDLG